jgi:hypothetical protein
MPRNGSGTYTRPQADYVPGTTILATSVNSDLNDMAQALTASIARDGQTTPTANIPLGGFRITGLGNAISATDAATLGQLSGAPVVLAEAIANNSATLDITTGLDNTYDRYELELVDLKPATNDVQAALRIGTGSGPTWQTGASAYASSILGIGPVSTALFGNTAGSFIPLSQTAGGNSGVISSAGYPGLRGLIRFYNPESTDRWNCNISAEHFASTGALASLTGSGFYGTASAITGLRFFFSTGNISSGSIRLLGYRK